MPEDLVRDRARETDPARTLRRRGEHDRGRGDREVRSMVLAEAEDVEPDLLGALDLLEEVPESLCRADTRPVSGSGVSSAKV